MIYRDKNFSGEPLKAEDGDEFIGGNMSQVAPGTVISTARDLSFTGANMVNVFIDPKLNWKIDDCNNCQRTKEDDGPVVDPIDAQVKEALLKMDELAKAYPDKVSVEFKAAIAKEQVEGPISATVDKIG